MQNHNHPATPSRRRALAFLPTIAIAVGIGSTAQATPKDSSYGAELDAMIANIPGLEELVEEEEKHSSHEEIVTILTEFKRQRDEAANNQASSFGASQISPMGGTRVCVQVAKWPVVAYSWNLSAQGFVLNTLGAAADVTILGLPGGAVLGALGIASGSTGAGIRRWANKRSWPRKACVSVSS